VKSQEQVKEWQRKAVKLKDVVGSQISPALSLHLGWLAGNSEPTDYQSFYRNS
jgi:hypothetical protein